MEDVRMDIATMQDFEEQGENSAAADGPLLGYVAVVVVLLLMALA